MTGHLIHLGYPKTGSNFLRGWFLAHPQLAYADGGIAGFHNVYQIAQTGAAPRADVRYRVTSCEGLATPHPSFGNAVFDYGRERPLPIAEAQAEVCHILGSLFPKAKILLVTRGFRGMIESLHSQVVRSGGAFDLDQLCAMLGEALDRAENPFDYDRIIDVYANAFGRDNVIALPYELLRDDVTAFLAALESRLDVAHISFESARVNASLSPEEMYWVPRITRVASVLPRRAFALYVRGTMSRKFARVVRLLPRRGSGVVPDALVERFRGSATRLAREPLFAAYAREYLE